MKWYATDGAWVSTSVGESCGTVTESDCSGGHSSTFPSHTHLHGVTSDPLCRYRRRAKNKIVRMNWFDDLTQRITAAFLGEAPGRGSSSETADDVRARRRSEAPVIWLLGKTGSGKSAVV